MHAECSTIVLIKWKCLSILPVNFQKDLGGNSSLEEQIVHLSVLKKNIHINEYRCLQLANNFMEGEEIFSRLALHINYFKK